MVCVFSSHPEGRGAAENVEGRVGRIQQLMEALREERVKMEAAAEKADICQHVTHEYYLPDWGSDEDLCAKSQNFIKDIELPFITQSQQKYSQVLEQSRKLREDSRRLIQEEVEKMERDLAQARSVIPIIQLVIHLI